MRAPRPFIPPIISLPSLQILSDSALGPSGPPLALTPSSSSLQSSASSVLSQPSALAISPQIFPIMSAAVSSNAPADATSKALVPDATNPSFKSTAQNELITTSIELLTKYMHVNPFEQKFREENRKLAMSSGDLREGQKSESEPTMPKISLDNASMSSLLKLQNPLGASPNLFSTFSLFESNDLKTSDLSKLMQQEQGGLSTQQSLDCSTAPRTADVLNAVLDMSNDRLHVMNLFSQNPFFPPTLTTPCNSAPNSAGVLGVPTSIQAVGSPAQLASALAAVASSKSLNFVTPKLTVTSPQNSPVRVPITTNPVVNSLSALPQATTSSDLQTTLQSSISLPIQQLHPIAIQNSGLLTALNVDADWDSQDVKNVPLIAASASLAPTTQPSKTPQITPGSDFYNSANEDFGGPGASNGFDHNPKSNESEVSSSNGSLHGLTTSSSTIRRGRGRGRTTTADMPPDERRLTILERNKAAAVRKRKKEEHDEMIGRVQILEQERNQYATQTQVLRREVERLTALLKDREERCVCMPRIPQCDISNQQFLHQQHLMQAMKRKL